MSFTEIGETLFIFHTTKYRQSLVSEYKYYTKVFYNSNMLLVTSLCTGFIIGIVGCIYSSIHSEFNYELCSKILVVTMTASLASTFLFIGFYLITLELATYLKIDAENVILPVVTAISDVVSLVVLKEMIIYFDSADFDVLSLLFLCTMILFIICGFFAFESRTGDDFMPLKSIAVTALSSIICGFIVEKLSVKYPLIPLTFPFFSGMSHSIALIYLHKSYSDKLGENNKSIIIQTLLLIATAIGICYIILSFLIDFKFTIILSINFLVGFVGLTGGLILCINISICNVQEDHSEMFSLPLMSVFSDVFSVLILMIISLFI